MPQAAILRPLRPDAGFCPEAPSLVLASRFSSSGNVLIWQTKLFP
jgi:hypothetical protein